MCLFYLCASLITVHGVKHEPEASDLGYFFIYTEAWSCFSFMDIGDIPDDIVGNAHAH